MKRILLACLALLLVSSCTVYPEKDIMVSFFSDSPWEAECGREMWHKVRYFDGESVHTLYLDEGVKSFSIKGKGGKCVLVAAYPLGSLTPIGGFWNGRDEIYLYPEWGTFISALLDAAEERPGAVAEISLGAILLAEPDLRSIDVEKTMELVFDGRLNASSIPHNRLYRVPLDGILTGRWLSLQNPSDTFVVSAIHDDNSIRLYPGVWYYLCRERNLMLQVILTEKGECRTRLSAPPIWY